MIEPGPYEHLSVSVDDSRATVTIDRPKLHNAIDVTTILDLDRAFNEIELRRDVAVVVVEGAGESAFSSGADLNEYHDDLAEHEAYQRTRGRLAFEMSKKARSLHAPTIATIDGYCIGAGLVLALYCDLRMATKGSMFGMNPTTIGQIPGGGATYRLIELVGEARAKELVLTGTLLSETEALDAGLVNRIVEGDELTSKVDELVAELSGENDKRIGATKAAKASLNANADASDRDDAFVLERERWWAQFDTDEQRTLVDEFLDE